MICPGCGNKFEALVRWFQPDELGSTVTTGETVKTKLGSLPDVGHECRR